MEIIIKKVVDKYLITLPNHYTSRVFIVDDQTITKQTSGEEKIWSDIKPSKIQVSEEKKKVTSYGNLSVDAYEAKKLELRKGVYVDDGYDIFPTLESEFEYKKFIQEHQPNYVSYTDIIDCKLLFIDITGRVDNPYIVPFRYLGGKDVNDSLYRYTPQPYKLAQEIATKYGFTEVEDKTFNNDNTKDMKWSVPYHSRESLRFIKINGSYEDSAINLPKHGSEPKFYGVTAGTWEECEKAYNSHYEALDYLFRQAKAKYKAIGQDIDRAKVIKELESIGSLINRIDAKAKSEITPRNVINRINAFKAELLKD